MKPLLTASASLAMIAGVTTAALADTGTSTVTLTEAHAVMNTGAPAPAYDSYCRARFGEYLGQDITTSWSIDTSTLLMHADSEVFGSSVHLFPLGIQGIYAFMSDGVPEALQELHVDRILFKLDSEMEDPESDVMFVFGGPVNCVLSNKASN
jgi:hypothetical protein